MNFRATFDTSVLRSDSLFSNSLRHYYIALLGFLHDLLMQLIIRESTYNKNMKHLFRKLLPIKDIYSMSLDLLSKPFDIFMLAHEDESV